MNKLARLIYTASKTSLKQADSDLDPVEQQALECLAEGKVPISLIEGEQPVDWAAPPPQVAGFQRSAL